jgi:hypothetical protein
MEPVLTIDKLGLANWIATGSSPDSRHAHFVAADLPAARQRIAEKELELARFVTTVQDGALVVALDPQRGTAQRGA